MLPVVTGEFGVVKEPEIRFTDKGTAWAKIRCSAKDRKRDANGNWTDGDPLYIDVIVGNGSQNLVDSVMPGDSIIVTGRLKMREYEYEGQKRQEFQISADSVGVSLRWNTAKTPRLLEQGGSMSSADVADALGGSEIPF